MISNVSVHEVYPGHYVQFLYAKNFPSDVRKVFSANTNVEGWAHYAEQMMLDEGLHGGDPKYRLAQLQDALLRDVRFLVGIKLHTQGLTIDEATHLFETAGPSAASGGRGGSQARRGRSAVRLLYDGQADDPRAPRRLQGEAGPDRTRSRDSTTRFSRSARSRCRSFGGRCSGRPASCSRCVRRAIRAAPARLLPDPPDPVETSCASTRAMACCSDL